LTLIGALEDAVEAKTTYYLPPLYWQ
jgi:hypothetical protein